jgi:four helix bundle protein
MAERGIRMDNDNYGHRKMIVWKNLDMIEEMVLREILPKLPRNLSHLIDQIDRSCSSSVANFIEGYYSGSLKEYIRFLKYSKRSLAELQDWVRRTFRKSFIEETQYLKTDTLIIRTMFLLNRLINSLSAKNRP